MATLNRTFSVKNGIDVANTIIVDSNRNLSNIANVSITGWVYTTPALAANTTTDSAFRIQPNTQPSTPEHRNIFRVSSYYNAGVNGHDFFIKTDENNRFVLASDWGNALRLGCITNSGAVANAVPSTYLSLSTSTAAFVGLAATVSGNLTVDTNVLHVDSVANRVGINRTDPGASLDVTSSAAFAARITGPANVYQDLTDGTGTARLQLLSNAPILTSIGAHALMFGTNNTERVRIDPVGNVGIGTTAPLAKFTANGSVWLNQVTDYSGATSTIQMSSGSSTNNIMIRTNSLYLYNYGNTGETLLRFGNGFETWSIGTNAGATPDFRLFELNGAATRLIVKANGNVGIGTTSPGYKLDVSDSSRIAGTLHFFGALRNYSGDMTLNQAVDANMIFQTNLTERMRISNTGNVGIGTATPNTKLHTVGEHRVEHVADRAMSFVKSGANTFSIEHDSSRFYIYNVDTANSMLTMLNDGRVGIGTVNPSFKLHVAGNMDAGTNRLLLDNDGGGSAIMHAGIMGISNSGWTLSTGAAGGGTQVVRMVVNSAGNVGIGTTAPGYKLEVAGAFAAQTKSFIITHPTKPDMKLRYGSLEGPENGVYVRGRSKNGIIRLPDYWTGLVDESTITVNLTPIGSHQKLFVEEIVDNTVIVGGGWFDSLDFFYTVFAERKDVDKLIVEI